MENASKALIIAGAILLSILIISLGIAIFNQASGVLNNNSMTEVEVSTFNQKFEQYTGDKVRGANVNSLINAVNTNNMSTDDDTKTVKLVTSQDKNGTELGKNGNSYKKDTIKTGSTYNVRVEDETTGGLISVISIVENIKTP